MLRKMPRWIWLCLPILLLAGCGSPAAPPPLETHPLPTQPASDPIFQSSGGGEPRTAEYWLLWNTCLPGNQAATARANGGREAGWILLDDLLADPGILVGSLDVQTCLQGTGLLQQRDLAGGDHANDPAYSLAAQLLSAQLNLAAGAESCVAADQAVQAAQLLLISLSFDGAGRYLGPPVATQDRDTALILTDQLAQYNGRQFCVP